MIREINKTWDQYKESTEVDKFLNEIKQICIKHNMVITYDKDKNYDAFVVEKYAEKLIKQLSDAQIGQSL